MTSKFLKKKTTVFFHHGNHIYDLARSIIILKIFSSLEFDLKYLVRQKTNNERVSDSLSKTS